MSRGRLGARMVRWLGPTGLTVNALDVILSRFVSRWADTREHQRGFPDDALPPEGSAVRYPPDESLWVDYVADTGDGWRSTYTVAWLMCQPHDLGGTSTEAGKILVLGGDQVYPSAKLDRYRERLVRPFQIASRQLSGGGDRDLYAVPGNHDWYDGLSAFTELFVRREELGVWRTSQTRSYFAVQLPHRWWLIGIDIAFDSELDAGQLEYFRRRCGPAADQIRPGDRIILCTGRPTWATRFLTTDPRLVEQAQGTLLEAFEREITETWGCTVPLVVSGDLHHYSRYAARDGTQHRVTAGGGGAYLYPTRGLKSPITWAGHDFERMAAFPAKNDTSRSRWKLLIAPFLNPPFLVMLGVLHLLVTRAVVDAVDGCRCSIVWAMRSMTVLDIVESLFTHSGALLVLGLAYLALRAYADGRTRRDKWIAASVHWLFHVAAMVGSTAVATWAATRVVDTSSGTPVSDGTTGVALVTTAIVSAVAGAILGSVVFGLYLRIQDLRNRHGNDAFAALHIADRKSFVRLELQATGSLRLFAIGIPKVANARPSWDADDGISPIVPEGHPVATLIEGPILIAGVDRGG